MIKVGVNGQSEEKQYIYDDEADSYPIGKIFFLRLKGVQFLEIEEKRGKVKSRGCSTPCNHVGSMTWVPLPPAPSLPSREVFFFYPSFFVFPLRFFFL